MRKLTTLLLLFSLFFILIPPVSAADEVSEKQAAVAQTAYAYFLKGAQVQYDSVLLNASSRARGGNNRTTSYGAPEDSTSQKNYYTVCSAPCFEIYYNALGYALTGSHITATSNGYMTKLPEDMTILHYDAAELGEAKRQEYAQKAMTLLQPGDLIIRIDQNGAPHSLIYCGDLDGDGKGDLVVSGGDKYNMDTATDKVESNGSLKLRNAENYLMGEKGLFVRDRGFRILRPVASADLENYSVTPAARSRVKYPAMEIDRTVSCGLYGTAVQGKNITYIVKITNHSNAPYENLHVTETVPYGTTLISEAPLDWTLNIPAGKTKTLSYTVRVDAPVGSILTNGGGKVDEIPSNVLKNAVGGKKIDTAKLKNFSGTLQAADGLNMVEELYRKALGIELKLPSFQVLLQGCFRAKNVADYTLAETPKYGVEDVFRMMVPSYLGGKRVLTETASDRVLDLRDKHLEAGDILLCSKNLKNASAVYLYTGSKLLKLENGILTAVSTAATLETLLAEEFFLLLRPRQAYEDISAQLASLSFTDVQESDWFYPYVRDLVQNGTVSGMTATTFAPHGNLTYGQALKLITLAAGEAEQAPTATHWASGYLTLAQKKGWLSDTVNPDSSITRLQFCQIAAKAKKLTAQPTADPFTDCSDPAVLSLYHTGVINGVTATSFAPDDLLTRAQIAKIIWSLNGI